MIHYKHDKMPSGINLNDVDIMKNIYDEYMHNNKYSDKLLKEKINDIIIFLYKNEWKNDKIKNALKIYFYMFEPKKIINIISILKFDLL